MTRISSYRYYTVTKLHSENPYKKKRPSFSFPEFQKYDVPEDVLLLRGLCLHGLASFPPSLGQHEESFEPLPVQPLPEMQKNSGIRIYAQN